MVLEIQKKSNLDPTKNREQNRQTRRLPTVMAKILVDSDHAALEDPGARNAFIQAVPASRQNAAGHFKSATHGDSEAPSSREAYTNVPTSPPRLQTTLRKSARETPRQCSSSKKPKGRATWKRSYAAIRRYTFILSQRLQTSILSSGSVFRDSTRIKGA